LRGVSAVKALWVHLSRATGCAWMVRLRRTVPPIEYLDTADIGVEQYSEKQSSFPLLFRDCKVEICAPWQGSRHTIFQLRLSLELRELRFSLLRIREVLRRGKKTCALRELFPVFMPPVGTA